MSVSRETEADVAAAVEGFPWITGVYALNLSGLASEHPDALSFAIVLSPYSIGELVQTHYALLNATGERAITGRVLYVNGAMPSPVPLARARRIFLGPEEAESARRRIAERRVSSEKARTAEEAALQLQGLDRAFRQLAETAARDKRRSPETAARDKRGSPVVGASPYRERLGKPLNEYTQEELQEFVNRAFEGSTIVATFASGGLEVVSDPFPSPARPRILVVDDDPTTEHALAELEQVDVVYARDAWTAIDQLTEGEFDLVLCAVALGGFSGARIHRLVAKTRPQMASRIVFLAGASVVAQAPPSSASGRVLPRPVDPAAVIALLKP